MTYYARLYMIPSGNAATEKSKLQEIVMDMRPSGAERMVLALAPEDRHARRGLPAVYFAPWTSL